MTPPPHTTQGFQAAHQGIPPAPGPDTSYSGDAWAPPQRKTSMALIAVLGLLGVGVLLLGAVGLATLLVQPGQAPPPPVAEGAVDSDAAAASIRITIRSTPKGASILQDSRPIGQTPMVVELSRDMKDATYTLEMEDHEPATRTFTLAELTSDEVVWDASLAQRPKVVAEADETDNNAENDGQQVKEDAENKNDARAARLRARQEAAARRKAAAEANKAADANKGDKGDKQAPKENTTVKEEVAGTAKANPGNKTEDRKPNVKTLDGGGSKPNVKTLDGGGSKPNVKTLDDSGSKPKVKPLE